MRILENANELVESIACGSKPTVHLFRFAQAHCRIRTNRCQLQADTGLTLRKVSKLNIKYKLFCFLFLVVSFCKPSELKVSSIELCENFSSEGICREKLDKEHKYHIIINRSKKFETWESFSNYLYFHSRQTPGFIVRFNRKFTMTEKELLQKTYKAKYEFYGSTGHVEGFEMGENWIGSFQYLGSIIKDRQRFFREDKNFPYMEILFPSAIKFSFDSALATGAISTEVNMHLEYKE